MNATTDWYSVATVGKTGTAITEAQGTMPTRMYTINGTETTVLFDTGLGVGDLAELVGESRRAPTSVTAILSHTHWDHIGNAHQFDDVKVHPAERSTAHTVGIDTLSDEFVARPAQFVSDHREQDALFPDSFDPDSFQVPPARDVGTVSDGDLIDIGGRSLEVVDIPGHSPGQIGLLDEDEGVLYGADLVHIHKNAYLHFSDSSLEDYQDALESVIELYEANRFETMTTGHNPPMSGEELEILYTLESGLQSIADHELAGEIVATPWGDARKFLVGESEILTKPSL